MTVAESLPPAGRSGGGVCIGSRRDITAHLSPIPLRKWAKPWPCLPRLGYLRNVGIVHHKPRGSLGALTVTAAAALMAGALPAHASGKATVTSTAVRPPAFAS